MNEIITNDAVRVLEQECLKQPQVQIGLTHHLSGGMYARTGVIKAGCLLIGAEHKTDHINIMYGDISVTTDDGVQRLTGYHVLPTKAGKKRAGVAHADTVWTTICRTDETELSKIEDELVVESNQLQSRNQELTNDKEELPCLE
jgi:hypothetical protein